MSRSSQNGALIKNGTVIEKLAKAQEIFLDKTGTITEGTIKVDSIKPVKSGNEAELLQLVYTVEKSSGHILAKAVLKLTSLTEVAGLGVIGEIDGEEIKIGRSLFAFAPDNLNYETAFYVSKSGKYIGAVTFSDTLRPEAKATIAQMRKIGLENITMLTGDNQLVADKIAKSVGIDNVYAGLMPDEKLKFIQNATHRPAKYASISNGRHWNFDWCRFRNSC